MRFLHCWAQIHECFGLKLDVYVLVWNFHLNSLALLRLFTFKKELTVGKLYVIPYR